MTVQVHAVSTGRRKGRKEGTLKIVFKILLSRITYWPEFGHVTIPNYNEAEKCSPNVGDCEPI